MTVETYSGRPYEELVEEGRGIGVTVARSNWSLGDLAIEVVGPSGTTEENAGRSGVLRQYAEDIGDEYEHIKQCRLVATAWTSGTRVPLVPWVNYRTIYKQPDREEIMASFVAKFDGSSAKRKPSYRNFQQHIGKDRTREFSKANTKETAEQALGDLGAPEQAEVIAPRLEDPEVAQQVIKKPRANRALVQAQAQEQEDRDREQGPPPMPRRDVLNEMNASIDTMRWELRQIHDRQVQITGTDRESVAASLDMVARQAAALADVIRNPGSASLNDADLAFLGGDPR